jgi:YVTN family beta-propeller protein
MVLPQHRLALGALVVLAVSMSLAQSGFAQPVPSSFVNFEASLTNPIRLSADGTRLYCVNNPKSTLSVFDLTKPTAPALIAEIPVGMEPVSVNPRTNDEVWVVNQESNTVSVVSVSKGIVTDTLQAKAEPSDVVFAGTNAFVSVSRSNLINVYDVTSHQLVKSIPVFGGSPRAMAVSPDGTTVYAAFALSGNGTTIIPYMYAPPPPAPTNPVLPAAPRVSLIIPWTAPAYTKFISWNMPDNDVVAINTASLAINKYFSGVGTINLGIAVQPSTGNLYVSNTDALNTIRFVENLNGHIVNNRISKITSAGTVTAYDLNPTVNYTNLPDPNSIAVALAQPAGIVFDSTGQNMYIAAFGTDRIASVDSNGNVLNRIEVDPKAIGPVVASATKRGPRGLAININTNTLYSFNRISNTISVINTTTQKVVAEIATGSSDPTPAAIRGGRGFLYDAKLSGNGTASCASCHPDGEADHLAWDLGDPNGSMFPVTLSDGSTFQEHPMKGPMTTLTLRGLIDQTPYHWRGDKPVFSDFNDTFPTLFGSSQISSANMTAFTNFVNTVTYMPNPFQNLDRSYPVSLNGGNPQNGANEFLTTIVNTENQTCNGCHTATHGGSDQQINLLSQFEPQPMKDTVLRAVYQKQLFNMFGATIDGFGLAHDGSIENITTFVNSKALFPTLATNPTAQKDIAAYDLAFDTGTAPAVGYAETLTAATVINTQFVTNWATLESQAGVSNCDLIAQGTINSHIVGLVFNAAQSQYVAAQPGIGPFTHAQLSGLVQKGGTLTVMGVPFGSGSRMAAN